jgi:hypothetical protein
MAGQPKNEQEIEREARRFDLTERRRRSWIELAQAVARIVRTLGLTAATLIGAKHLDALARAIEILKMRGR